MEVAKEPGRYVLRVDGERVGVADYHLAGDVVVVPHTEITAAHRGEGLGAVLVAHVLDDVRAAGRTVRADCWYVARYIADNPRYADLVTD